jgi:urease accessory protein
MSIAALLLADARFPAGGHAHSGGLEPAATAGTVTDMASLEVFLRGRLRTAGMVAAGLAAAACVRARKTGDRDADRDDAMGRASPGALDQTWAELDMEADARTPSRAQREASRRQGRALLRAARAAWPDADWLAGLAAPAATREPKGAVPSGLTSDEGARREDGMRRRPEASGEGTAAPATTATGAAPAEYRGGPHHAVVLGAAVAAAGCSAEDAARIAAYQSVAGPASAAVRLLALDPMRAAAVLAGLSGAVDDIASTAASYAHGPLADLPYPSAPALDLLAEAHIRAEVRLFES